MKQLHTNWKKGEVKLQVEHLDDLWYLKQILAPKDRISGKTMRKIATTSQDQRAKAAAKKPVFLSIEIEKVEFSATSSSLRASGKVVAGPEDVPLGSHHTFTLEENTQFSVQKEQWLSYQKDKLKEAVESDSTKVLICVLDREEAYFASLKKYGYELLGKLQGNVTKKGDDSAVTGDFYGDIVKQLQDYNTRLKLNHVIIASPAFWKEELQKKLPDDIKKLAIMATTSSVNESGITEVLKRPEVQAALHQERATQEIKQAEKLLEEISKEGLATYGLKETAQAANAGAVETLLVTDSCIQQSQENETYDRLEQIMKTVDSSQGSITIISADHEGGQKLNGLGGVGALLRYQLNY